MFFTCNKFIDQEFKMTHNQLLQLIATYMYGAEELITSWDFSFAGYMYSFCTNLFVNIKRAAVMYRQFIKFA